MCYLKDCRTSHIGVISLAGIPIGGGYPPDIDFLPGHVVIAEPDPGKDNARAMLTVFTNKEVRAWHKRTKRLVKRGDMEWDEAVMEAE